MGRRRKRTSSHGHTGSACRKLITEFLTAIVAEASVPFKRWKS